MSATTARLLADAVLALHAAFVAFVVLGLVAILVGGALRWRSVRDPYFRALHLAAIGLVLAEAWAGVTCPLTSLEDSLRAAAGEATYSGAFVAHWLGRFLYWQAPPVGIRDGLHDLRQRAGGSSARGRSARRLDAPPIPENDPARPARAPDGPSGCSSEARRQGLIDHSGSFLITPPARADS